MAPRIKPKQFTWRAAFSLIELIVVVAILSLLAGLVFAAIQFAREASRRAECSNNLRQIGLALHTYNNNTGSFPPGLIYGSALDIPDVRKNDPGDTSVYATAFALLLPYIEPELSAQYRNGTPWNKQAPAVIAAVVPGYLCPSSSHDNPWITETLSQTYGGTGQFGVTDFILCKGVYDGWCISPAAVAKNLRGMFDVSLPSNYPLSNGASFAVRDASIGDGQSNSLCVGEGAEGTRWPICPDPGGVVPTPGTAAYNIWSGPPNTSRTIATPQAMLASIFGCTIETINKSPVTQTVIYEDDVFDLLDCRSSLENRGSRHRTSNFRSEHPSGMNGLYADGSVQFLDEDIDLNVFRALSTIDGGD